MIHKSVIASFAHHALRITHYGFWCAYAKRGAFDYCMLNQLVLEDAPLAILEARRING